MRLKKVHQGHRLPDKAMLGVIRIVMGHAPGVIRTLRGWTERTVDREPKWRHPGHRLDTGFDPPWR